MECRRRRLAKEAMVKVKHESITDEDVKLAERATFGGDDQQDVYRQLDDRIRVIARAEQRTIQEVADELRMRAIAGDHYRPKR